MPLTIGIATRTIVDQATGQPVTSSVPCVCLIAADDKGTAITVHLPASDARAYAKMLDAAADAVDPISDGEEEPA